MILTWIPWLFIVLFTLVGQAIWRVLRWWYVPIGGAIAGFVLMFIIGIYDLIASGKMVYHLTGVDTVDQRAEAKTRAFSVAGDLRWWHRWRSLGVARLLSDHWTKIPLPPLGYPSRQQDLTAFLHVALAASVTVGSLVLVLLFLYALADSFRTMTQPFGEGARS